MLNKKALAASVSAPPAIYPEDVFSTYLYTGNGSTQTITNDIDLDGEGGLVWIKDKTLGFDPYFQDTERGITKSLSSNSTAAEVTRAQAVTAVTSSGFSLGNFGGWNENNNPFVSWTFRKQPKFFDVVTYTGNGSARTVAHNLGSVPGMIIVKRTDTTGDWQVYHRANTANPETDYLVLNTDAATADSDTRWNDTQPTSSVFSLGTDATVNANTGTYVAYLFAHDAGGFGTAGTDNVISCGSYTGNGSATGTSVTLGYEPQWLLIRRTDSTGDWNLIDNMRGFVVGGTDAELNPNLSNAESTGTFVTPTATGFNLNTTNAGYNASSATYIYMAIRRPMKVPTTGIEVFSPIVQNAAQGTKATTGFTVDMQIETYKTGGSHFVNDRLRGVSSNTTNVVLALNTTSTAAENNESGVSAGTRGWDNTGFQQPFYYDSANAIFWNFRRASGFFDVVCYTGNATAGRTVTHNLTVAPELMIVKRRDSTSFWRVYASPLGATKNLYLQDTSAEVTASNIWNDTNPTSTVFTVGDNNNVNSSGGTHVAYLFATCAGVSKVGTYTGNGSTQAIACGFTGGARFVLIKRTDDTGDWYVYDTARGMTVLTNPYLELNTADAESATLGSVTTTTGGFTVDASILAAINTNAASYIFLAIS